MYNIYIYTYMCMYVYIYIYVYIIIYIYVHCLYYSWCLYTSVYFYIFHAPTVPGTNQQLYIHVVFFKHQLGRQWYRLASTVARQNGSKGCLVLFNLFNLFGHVWPVLTVRNGKALSPRRRWLPLYCKQCHVVCEPCSVSANDWLCVQSS